MTLEKKIQLLCRLGDYLLSDDEYLKAIMHRTQFNNGWLTIENCEKACRAIAFNFLQEDKLKAWCDLYQLTDAAPMKKVGIVMAGNIPLVGFHDLISVFLSGNQSIIKLSDKDKYLLPQLIKKMGEWEEESKDYFKIVEKLAGFEAVIATGSNNSARYFERYFGKYPHIIRKNRNAIALLSGEESMADLYALGNDIFEYFGLGCRNVSKLYLPRNYQFEPLLEALHEYRNIILNNKYKNNFDYNYAMFMLNKVEYKANGCIILLENEAISSRIASLHYEFYEKEDILVEKLQHNATQIQCIISKMEIDGFQTIPFGDAQKPSLTDYADGVDTMEFLTNL